MSLPARVLLAVLALALVPPAAEAHDFWIEPTTFTPTGGEVVALRLRVGEELRGEPVGRNPALLRRFTAWGAHGERGVPGLPGSDPAGFLRTQPGDGTLLVAYESAPSEVELDEAKLDRFLREEGFAALADERRRRGASSGAVDQFSRHVKALLHCADGAEGTAENVEADSAEAPSTHDRTVGLELELVPLRDPAALHGGGELPLRLLFAGRPLAGTRVMALPHADPTSPLVATTGEGGEVTLRLPPGEWLLKAVQVVPAGGDPTAAVLRSYWASLALRVPAG